MPQWTEAAGGKLTLVFDSTEDLRDFREQVGIALDYLDQKYSQNPKDAFLVVLAIQKQSASDAAQN